MSLWTRSWTARVLQQLQRLWGHLIERDPRVTGFFLGAAFGTFLATTWALTEPIYQIYFDLHHELEILKLNNTEMTALIAKEYGVAGSFGNLTANLQDACLNVFHPKH